jgi:hypothetical protein
VQQSPNKLDLSPGSRVADHCARMNDMNQCPDSRRGREQSRESGSSAARLGAGRKRHGFTSCRVPPPSSVGRREDKLIVCRSVLEGRFLDAIVTFLTRCRAAGTDELFSFRNIAGGKIAVSCERLRRSHRALACVSGTGSTGHPLQFDSHRETAITDVRAAGAAEESRQDRG